MILWRASLRTLLHRPLLLLFAILGVALGVAVVVAIDLANASAEQAFRLPASALSGRATHQVVGGPTGLDEGVYRRLRMAGLRVSAPIVEGYAAVPASPGLTLQLLGVDPFAEEPFRPYVPAADGGGDIGRLLTEPGSGLLLQTTAERLGLKPGDSLDLEIGGSRRTMILRGYLQPGDAVAARALESLLVIDIATAQEFLGRVGRLSRIDLLLSDGEAGAAQLARIRSFLPPSATVVSAGERSDFLASMTDAFRLNLTALSLLALVVGMFLIYNTFSFSVLQRRELLGTLRTLGVTRGQLFALVLGEAALIGAVGTALGLLLGLALGNGLLHLVTRTINDLYFVVSVRNLAVSPFSLGKGIVLGLGASMVAALVPAWEAAMAAPRTVLSRSLLESRRRRLLPLAAAAGLLLMLAGGGLLLLPGRSIPLAFLALFALIAGYALVVPWLATRLLRMLQPICGVLFGILGRMAARNLIASLSRTGVATAALVVAVSATIGVGIMIGSFRLTLVHWLESYLRADIYVAAAATGNRPPLQPALVERLSTLPEIALVTRARHVELEWAAGPTALFVVDMTAESFAGYDFTSGNREEIQRAMLQSAEVIVSEPFAFHQRLQPGDSLRLRTDAGEREFRIAGVFTDYSSDRGRVVMSRPVYEQYWNDRTVDALGLYLRPGTDIDRAVEAVRRAAGERQQVTIYSNLSLRQTSLATFDRTFAITAVLRMLAVLIAFVGILNALMAMQIERARELAVLRANGLTPGQLWGLVNGETGLIGLLAGVLALPLGLLQALVLIFVINRRSFGWSLQIYFDPAILAQAVALALAASLLAGLYPAWRMARTSPALALREE